MWWLTIVFSRLHVRRSAFKSRNVSHSNNSSQQSAFRSKRFIWDTSFSAPLAFVLFDVLKYWNVANSSTTFISKFDEFRCSTVNAFYLNEFCCRKSLTLVIAPPKMVHRNNWSLLLSAFFLGLIGSSKSDQHQKQNIYEFQNDHWITISTAKYNRNVSWYSIESCILTYPGKLECQLTFILFVFRSDAIKCSTTD